MSQTRSVEWLLACMMAAWGFGLMLPGDTMSLPQYRLLQAIAPEYVWASWSLTMGTMRLLALYINGSWRRTPLFRVAGASLGFVWWLVLGFLFFESSSGSGPVPAGLMWFPVFIAFEGYSIVRGARDSYHTRALQRWPSSKP